MGICYRLSMNKNLGIKEQVKQGKMTEVEAISALRNKGASPNCHTWQWLLKRQATKERK